MDKRTRRTERRQRGPSPIAKELRKLPAKAFERLLQHMPFEISSPFRDSQTDAMERLGLKNDARAIIVGDIVNHVSRRLKSQMLHVDMNTHSGMEHPLKCLRECVLNNLKMYEKGDYIVLGEMAFHKSCITNYVVWNKKKEYYTLESLYFFVKNRNLVHTCYVKEAAARCIQIVTRPDRKSLEDYLTNEKSERPPHNVDNSAPLCPYINIKELNAQLMEPEQKRARKNQEEMLRKERLFNMLGKGVVIEQDTKISEPVRELSKDLGLTADKIAALRSKALARKRTQIQTIEDDLEVAYDPVTVVPSASQGSEQETQMVTDEVVYTTQDNVLEAVGLDFSSLVFPILIRLGLHYDKNDAGKSKPDAVPNVLQAFNGPAGYSRYEQDRFWKTGTDDFKIDTSQTFAMSAFLDSGKSNGAFLSSSLYAAYRHGVGQGEPVSLKMIKEGNRVSKHCQTAIIVVPSTRSTIISLWNVEQLLQNLRYVSIEEMKRQQGAKQKNEVLIHRRHEKLASLPFRIVDNTVRFTEEEWSRVVAVFVQGYAWELKGWPMGGNPAAIFRKVCPFHLKWDDEKLDGNIAKWGVNVVSLSRTKRHLDKGLFGSFWETLDKFVWKARMDQ